MWGKEMGKWLAEDTTALYGAIIRLHRSYCCFMEGYSIYYIGTASRLYRRRAKNIIIIIIVTSAAGVKWAFYRSVFKHVSCEYDQF